MFRLWIASPTPSLAARSIAIERLRLAERIVRTDLSIPMLRSRRLARYDPVQPAYEFGKTILLQERDLRMFDQKRS